MEFPDSPDQQFLAISSVLTAFPEIDLLATGQLRVYWEELSTVVGLPIAGDFLDACGGVFREAPDLDALELALDAQIMKHAKYGPLARNVITMWYFGQWNALPRDWRDLYGGSTQDVGRVISVEAYKQGLVWPAFGTHPQGAKPAGFGSWSTPPINPVNTDPPKS